MKKKNAMEKIAGKRNALREFFDILKDGLRFPRALDKVVDYPKSLRKYYYICQAINAALYTFKTFTAFLLVMVSQFIENGKIEIAVILFSLYLGKDIISDLLYIIQSEVNLVASAKQEEVLTVLTASITQKVNGKIKKNSGSYATNMEQEEILKTCQEYLNTLWRRKMSVINDYLNLVSTVILLYGVIKNNTQLPTGVLVYIIVGLVLFEFKQLHSQMRLKNPIRKERIEVQHSEENYINDLKRIPMLVNGDLATRVERYKKNVEKYYKLLKIERKKTGKDNLLRSLVLFLISSAIALSKLYFSSMITSATITDIIACLAIFNQATSQIDNFIWNISLNVDKMRELDELSKIMKKILEEYNQEERVGEVGEEMVIEPFDLQYNEASQNDKPFRLILNQKLTFHLGEIVVLTGPSASGKSTLMKVATNRVKTTHQTYYVASKRYMYFDETTSLGTAVSLFEELFNCSDFSKQKDLISEEELEKMREILENLNLWNEIKKRSKDPWQWLMEHKFNECSNGQKQRFIISKMLYWLSDEIDVICLDEVTSGLDEYAQDENSAGAHEVMEYIIRKCNEDRKRILFISTHQKSIESMAQRKLDFQEEGDKNNIVEVN